MSASREQRYQRALEFITELKLECWEESRVYYEILGALKSYSDRKIDMTTFIFRVVTLLTGCGHTSLIEGFNNFLPDAHKIKEKDVYDMYRANVGRLSPYAHALPVPPCPPTELDRAVNYVKLVKERLADNKYEEFLQIMQDTEEEEGVSEICDKAFTLFSEQSDADLLTGFLYFLPDSARGYIRSRLCNTCGDFDIRVGTAALLELSGTCFN